MSLPKKVYEGDSQNIFLTLDRKVSQEFHSTAFDLEDTANGKQITLEFQKKEKGEQSLEIELLAAAFEISGENKQTQSLQSEKLAYQWNCLFKSAGKHEVCFVLKVVDLSSEEFLGRIRQTIRVVKLDHATQRQVQMYTAVAGVVTLLMGISSILAAVFGIWHFH